VKSESASILRGCPTRAVARSSARSGWKALSRACAWSVVSACTLTTDDFDPDVVRPEAPPSAAMPNGSGANPSSAAGAGGASGNVGNSSGAAGDSPGPALPADDLTPPVIVPPGGSGNPDPIDAGDAGKNEPDVPVVSPDLTQLVGWASAAGLGVETTTGGALGDVVIARTATELIDFAARAEPLTIAIEGTLDVGSISVASNKTLVGVGADATLRGGISIRGTAQTFVTNVIVSNVNVEAATSTVEGDGIQIQFAHHVWIDHCALSDAADGLIDIEHGSDFVTVSFTRLFYTDAAPDPTHRFANVTGHALINGAEDRTHLNVTWHHDFWGDGVTQATLARFGRVHLFDNLFRSPGNTVVISAGFASSWLVENNHFEDVASPIAILPQSGASVVATNNVFVRTSGTQSTAGSAFVPPYAYELEPTLGLEARIVAQAGPR
jgi:pectate lyase